jgi:hypothetical protein
MFKLITTATDELEYPEKAIEIILADIEAQGGIIGEAIGIMMCPYEFLSSGFCAYISERLDFPVLGASTTLCATSGKISHYQFSMMVICSDTLIIRAGLSDSLNLLGDNSEAEVRRHIDSCFINLYESLTRDLYENPSLFIPFMPVLKAYSDNRLAKLLFADHKEPFFGAFAVDTYPTNRKSSPMVFYNGEYYDDRAALLMIHGDIKPHFYIEDMRKVNIANRDAIITKSEGNILFEVNNKPLFDFLSSMDIVDEKNMLFSVNTNPFILYDPNMNKYSPRIVHEVFPDGSMLFNAAMPEGITIRIGKLDVEDIAVGAKRIFDEIISREDLNGVIVFSCLNRQLNLGYEELLEATLLDDLLKERSIPFFYAFCGGEIIPSWNHENGFTNQLYNFSLVALTV